MEGSVKSLIEAESRAREIVATAENEKQKQMLNAGTAANNDLNRLIKRLEIEVQKEKEDVCAPLLC